MEPLIDLEHAIHHRRALHAIPETGLELPKTTAYIRTALAAIGIKAQDCAGGLLADFAAVNLRIAGDLAALVKTGTLPGAADV